MAPHFVALISLMCLAHVSCEKIMIRQRVTMEVPKCKTKSWLPSLNSDDSYIYGKIIANVTSSSSTGEMQKAVQESVRAVVASNLYTDVETAVEASNLLKNAYMITEIGFALIHRFKMEGVKLGDSNLEFGFGQLRRDNGKATRENFQANVEGSKEVELAPKDAIKFNTDSLCIKRVKSENPLLPLWSLIIISCGGALLFLAGLFFYVDKVLFVRNQKKALAKAPVNVLKKYSMEQTLAEKTMSEQKIYELSSYSVHQKKQVPHARPAPSYQNFITSKNHVSVDGMSGNISEDVRERLRKSSRKIHENASNSPSKSSYHTESEAAEVRIAITAAEPAAT